MIMTDLSPTPTGSNALTMFASPITNIEVAEPTVSELLRLYILGRVEEEEDEEEGEGRPLDKRLIEVGTNPLLPTEYGKVVSLFICGFVCGHLVSFVVSSTKDTMSSGLQI